VEVRRARDRAEVDAALALREQVFCVEQGVELAADQDGLDDGAIHVVAVDESHVVGTCRVLLGEDGIGRLGRMAVDRPVRGRGVGAAILAAAEHSARESGAHTMRLHAQRYVEHMYAAAGYSVYGEPFVEEGIPHVSMEKPLA